MTGFERAMLLIVLPLLLVGGLVGTAVVCWRIVAG